MKTFKRLPTFKMNKIKEEPEKDDIAVWDTEEYHVYKEDGSDELGLLCAAYKIPGKSAQTYYFGICHRLSTRVAAILSFTESGMGANLFFAVKHKFSVFIKIDVTKIIDFGIN